LEPQNHVRATLVVVFEVYETEDGLPIDEAISPN